MKLTNAELQTKINQMQEKLYDAGIEERPTMMSDIKAVEKTYIEKLDIEKEAYWKKIQRIHKKLDVLKDEYADTCYEIQDACEKETGKELFYNKFNFSKLDKEFDTIATTGTVAMSIDRAIHDHSNGFFQHNIGSGS